MAENSSEGTKGPAVEADGVLEPDAVEASPAGEASAESTAGAATDGGDAVDAAESQHDDPDDEVEYVEEKVVVMRRGPFIALAAIAALLIIALGAFGLYQWKKPAPTVATVNGSTISRADYDKAVAAANGQQVLDDLISQKLVASDAAKKKVTVSTDEVDAKLKEIKKQFPQDSDYRSALASQHLTELELRDRIRSSLLLQKLAGGDVQVTDQEIQQAFDSGKDTQYQGKSLDDVKASIKDDLTQQKQADAGSTYLDNLRKTAKITQHLPGQSKS